MGIKVWIQQIVDVQMLSEFWHPRQQIFIPDHFNLQTSLNIATKKILSCGKEGTRLGKHYSKENEICTVVATMLLPM